MKTARPRRPRRGFFILFGARTLISRDHSAEPVRAICPQCHRETDLVGKSHRTWFTIFFLPVFPISRSTPFTQCSACHGQFPVTPEQIRGSLSHNEQVQSQEAIGLYNSLRASPANCITLNQLMLSYAAMKEYGQAISAAADFPQALHNSEQCMTTLARVYLGQGDFDNAMKWFDAAINRNAHLAEAHYYKAIGHMMKTPPETEKATTAARAARNAGHPGAEQLLAEVMAKSREG